MIRAHGRWSLLVCILTLGGFVSDLYAQPSQTSRTALHRGMTLAEVQAQWGDPEEKIEQELKHQSIWHYAAIKNAPAVKLKFVNGTLLTEENNQGARSDRPSELRSLDLNPRNLKNLNRVQKGRAPKTSPHSFMALKDQKEVTEVLKEIPSEADVPEKPGSGSSAANPNSATQIE